MKVADNTGAREIMCIRVMGSGNRWELKQQANAGGEQVPVQLVPYFTFPNGKAQVRDATNAFGIYSKSQHRDEAWEYVRWITTEGHIMLIKMGWTTPLRKSLMDASYFIDSLNPAYESVEVYKTANENVRILSHVPRISEIDKTIQAAWEAAILKQKGIQQAMEEIIPDIEAVLAETAKTPLPQVG